MDKYKAEILEVIKNTDSVFDSIGRDFPYSQKNMLIFGMGHKSFEITSAIILLCDHGFNKEATTLLRSLIENTVKLKWILNKDTEIRTEQYFQEPDSFSWGKDNTDLNLKEKMAELGFSDEYYNKVLKVTHSFSHVNAESIDWSRIQKEEGQQGLNAGAIYSIVYQMLGHVLQTFHENVSKEFNFYEEIFNNLQTTQTDQQFLLH